jgi:hypothetical protein
MILVLIFDRKSWPPHRPWLIFFLLATIAATVAFFGFAYGHFGDPTGWPGGSSLPGLIFGVLGGAIILFEFLLWFRKKVRVWRIGRAQTWLRAHIWLGLLCVPLLIYHSGFRLGGSLSTVLMVLLLIVILSGIWGLMLQQILPTRMLEQVPAETIFSQIDRLSGQLSTEARQLIQATCGLDPDDKAADGERAAAPTPYLVVGAVRSAGRVQGKVLETRVAPVAVPGAEALSAFFQETVDPFLRGRADGDSPLRLRQRAVQKFGEVKTHLPPAAHPALETLAGMCDQRRQWDQQAGLQFWLHSWLWVHFPLSVALVVLMFVHIWVALKYW